MTRHNVIPVITFNYGDDELNYFSPYAVEAANEEYLEKSLRD